jgi:hypothetical protein
MAQLAQSHDTPLADPDVAHGHAILIRNHTILQNQIIGRAHRGNPCQTEVFST